MTVVKLRPALAEIKSLLGSDKEFLKPLVRTVLQEAPPSKGIWLAIGRRRHSPLLALFLVREKSTRLA